MNSNKPNNNDFDAWIEDMRRTTAPDRFSDRVLERIAIDQIVSVRPLWRSPALWAKAAILTLALVGGLGRYALLLVCLFTG